jgi:NhaA family Na+:H+ antiporter
MATDIAFAVGILSLAGSRVPVALKVLLTALAVIDDLGAIIVIALFYTNELQLMNLGIATGIFGILLLMNRMKVYNLVPYLFGGLLMWYFMFHSGVHATITGVLLAFAIPFGNGSATSPSYILQNFLHKPVAFVIIPLFALANTAIVIESNWYETLWQPGGIGVFAGLVLGKPLGIFLFSFASVAAGICVLPSGLTWKHILGLGCLGGIGFTMSIFITLLAYDDAQMVTQAKIAILLASAVSGMIGFAVLRSAGKRMQTITPPAAHPRGTP